MCLAVNNFIIYIKLIGPCNHVVYNCIVVMIMFEKECNANAAVDNELNQFSFTISSKILDLHRMTLELFQIENEKSKKLNYYPIGK